MNTIEVQKIGSEEMRIVDGMPIIAIYEKPAEYPEKFVARLWDTQNGDYKPTEIAAVADTIREIRKKIPWQKMSPIVGSMKEDPCIVEFWI
jgi:hypothetical protein